jgi:branched-chain amino acid transport system ATP-binding protein
MTTPEAAEPALETQALCKSFGALQVANEINFRLARGARHALIGPNGAGKTSFVNLVSGALEASSGKILLAGQEVTSPHRRSASSAASPAPSRSTSCSAAFRCSRT